jgi:Domain of unknown function (DUF3597)
MCRDAAPASSTTIPFISSAVPSCRNGVAAMTSIVDLMKLTGLDPSLANRKQLAAELGYKGDTADSATMNIWLHKAVMDKLAASGGQVTPELKA